MIQVDITAQRGALLHACGEYAKVIETRGRSITSPRLIGAPNRTYHVECPICGVCTQPTYQVHLTEALWRVNAIHRIQDLPALRTKSEESLLRAQAVSA